MSSYPIFLVINAHAATGHSHHCHNIYTNAAIRVGTALEGTKLGRIIKEVAKGTEGYMVPVSPAPASLAGNAGAVLEWATRKHNNTKSEK